MSQPQQLNSTEFSQTIFQTMGGLILKKQIEHEKPKVKSYSKLNTSLLNQDHCKNAFEKF